jgi:hypothetical protein
MNGAVSTPAAITWRKSTYSEPTANCVEVAAAGSGAARRIGVRDSKFPSGPYLWFTPDVWAVFIAKTRRPAGARIPDGDGDVVTRHVPTEQVPADFRRDDKIFESGRQAITVRGTAGPGSPVLYFTEAEWDAFVAGVTAGEFDDLLADEPGQRGR